MCIRDRANTTFKADGTYTGSAVCDTYNYNVTVTIVISGEMCIRDSSITVGETTFVSNLSNREAGVD